MWFMNKWIVHYGNYLGLGLKIEVPLIDILNQRGRRHY